MHSAQSPRTGQHGRMPLWPTRARHSCDAMRCDAAQQRWHAGRLRRGARVGVCGRMIGPYVPSLLVWHASPHHAAAAGAHRFPQSRIPGPSEPRSPLRACQTRRPGLRAGFGVRGRGFRVQGCSQQPLRPAGTSTPKGRCVRACARLPMHATAKHRHSAWRLTAVAGPWPSSTTPCCASAGPRAGAGAGGTYQLGC